ncbi:hypothetical protein Pla163_03850 [Planctomycetes bacterium Pla163]|uniref:Uncharacterized protein n=1 Tax=Rohdeia mirabilis TaxID=2528008 RepID=A0A518CVM9_9BACT|nr:hypothetical protein Pla163_03850 [Planctomycetes bacterium Pla163]
MNRIRTATLTLLAAAGSLLGSDENETPSEPSRLEPRTMAWQDLGPATFDPAWLLPESRGDGGSDLLTRMRTLLALEIPWTEADGTRSTLRFADLVVATRGLDDSETRKWLKSLAKRSPAFEKEWGDAVGQLLRDDYLRSSKWKPSNDSETDGIYFGDSWELHEDPENTWGTDGEPRIEQATSVFLADMDAIKEAENDYRAYPDNVGADYEAIGPVADSYFIGVDAAENRFACHRLYFRQDLPFPFSDYECDLHILSRINALGEVVTDIYSPTDDFYYMGGRDTFLPLETAAGDWVGYLNVRWFGFDLDGVPDGASDRKEAMRGSLGNLRRNAERIFAESGGERRTEVGVVPPFEVVGTLQE